MATQNGTIKRITDKGFGFIAASDGTEYFFHQSACVGTRFDELREGQRVTFTTTGEIQLSDNPSDIANANGAKDGRLAPNAPIKGAAAGALIAKVGNSAPFPIGLTSAPVTMPANGVLYLGVNDDGFGDNRGNFQVIVR